MTNPGTWWSMVRGLAKCGLVFVLAVMAGCATSLPRADVTAGGRVLLLNAVPATLANDHMGVLIFSSYYEQIENDWDVRGLAQRTVTARLQGKGYTVIPLTSQEAGFDPERMWPRESASAVDPRFLREKTWLVQRLLAANDASALVVLGSYYRSYGPNAKVSYRGYGISSGFGWKPDRAQLFATVGATVMSGDPLVVNASASMEESDCRQMISTEGFPVGSLKRLTAAHLAPYRPVIEGFVVRRLEQDLVASGLVDGPAEACVFIPF